MVHSGQGVGTGASQALSAGELSSLQVDLSKRLLGIFQIPRMFQKVQGGAQDIPEPQNLIATAFTWPRKFMAFFNPSSPP